MTFAEIMMAIELGLIYGIISVGIYLTFRVIDFPDLTCDGSFVLGAASSSVAIKIGYNSWSAMLIAIIAGAIAGFITGILYIHLQVKDLLAGILVCFMLYTINLHVMCGVPSITLNDLNTIFYKISPFSVLGFISFMVCASISYLLITDYGLAIRSIGQNKRFAQNNGINVKIMIITILALSNGIIALGGALISQHQGFVDINMGIGTIIVGIASVMIGEKILPSKSILVQVISCFIGAIMYRLLIGLALYSDVLGLQTYDLNLITGVMIIGVMYIPSRRIC